MNNEPKLIKILNEEEKHRVFQVQPQSEYEEQQMLQESEDRTSNKTFNKVKEDIKRTKDDGGLGAIENTYRTIFENYAVAITLVDEKERIVSWNKYAEELLGMDEKELYLKPVSMLYPPDEWQRIRKENVRQKGIKYRMETKIIRKDKTSFDVEISICVLKSEKGKIVGSVGIIKDIAKQKEMEKALEKSEKRFKQLYENAPVPYHTLSPSGVITEVNGIWCQLLGYRKDEVVGRSIFEFVHETEREIAKASFEKKLQSKIIYPQSNERAYITKTGEKRLFMIRDFFSFDERNDVTAVYTIMNDVTDLKKAEYELQKTEIIRESARRLQTVIDTVNDGITLSDKQGHFEIFNTKMEEITGYTKHEADVCNDFISLIYPDQNEQKRALENISETLKKGVSKNFETTIQTKEGTNKILLVSTSMVQIDNRKMFLSVYHDITERIRTEEALRKSEEKFRLLFNDSPAGIALIDPKGIAKEVNKSLLRLLPIKEEKFVGKNFFQLVSAFGLDIEGYIADFKNRIGGESPKREITFLSKDNRQVTIAVQSSVIKSGNEILGILFIMQDITVRKQAEEALQESEERHRILFESSRDAIMTLEPPSWSFTSGNPATVKMFKAKNAEEFISYGPGDLSPERQPDGRASAEKAKEMIEKAMREGSCFFEWTHKRLDGTDFPATVMLARMEIKGKQFLQATVRDITEQKQTETEREKILLWQQGVNTLQQSLLAPTPLNEKLKTITDNIVRLFDADFCRIWLTQHGDLCEQGCIHAEVHEGPHVCRYHDRCLRLRVSSGRYTHTDGKIHRRVPFGCYKIGRVASGVDHKFLTNDVQNDPRVHNNDWARELGLESFAGYQLRVPGGETIGVLALFAKHPISHVEDTILDGLSSTVALVVQQAVADDTMRESKRKIETQNIQLQKLDKIKSDFLNITSHELRTPMSAIKGYTQMVFKQKLGQITDEQRHALNVVLRNTDRLDNLIRDILDVSRLESGTIKFVPEKTDAGKMVNEAVETMQPTADLKNIKINTEIEPYIPEMMVDHERIKQVIINIVNNAIKFSPNGTIINVRTKKDNDQVLFEIQDYGRGIPKDKQEKIFEIFYQVDSGMDRKFGGAGLGLAISRGIILSHGGKIWVDSEPEKGSIFYFSLPITPVEDLEGKFRDVDIFKLKESKRAIENDLRNKTVIWDDSGEKRGEKP